MNRRIVKETLKNGHIQYRVEVYGRPTIFSKKQWYTDTKVIFFGFVNEITSDAVFDTLKEAQIHCGINPNPVIRREIIT